MLTDFFRLDGKTALVTGAGKGIGARIATAFAEMGADLILLARTESDLEQVARDVEALGQQARVFPCDITDEAAIATTFNDLKSELPKLDIVVNNAGAPGKGFGSLAKVTKKRFEHTLDINLSAAYGLIHEALPLLQASPDAAIVNISSAMSWMVDRHMAAYAAAKAGLDQMTRVLAYELAPKIRVNGIAPGAIETPATAFITQDPGRLEDTVRWIPQGRLGQPTDIALAALYLSSNASSFISGKILEVDGGMAALPGSAIQSQIPQPKA
ncbi:MAG: glucose 1-dehydrogenase [Halieaceae bacterium]|jgi:7-alpha-hydroxysteroid dehydrogenase|nr:glucose 1-dehydrogenase [Halieaceae bacterium]MBT5209769.1 glucose 1-dehydrogenase [Halieaceae bacterium]MBT6333611.1 glucose 1-dehydrogenase [Halieaceae bacterium]MBT7340568.1 glucose 1-dehydrogenase [Halieaceae bacterium]MDG2136633.1 glucose 1-dehydrogenase [Luminiphilus sp.]